MAVLDKQCKIKALADGIYEAFVKEDGGEWLRRTGSIACQANLRVRKTRKAFALLRRVADGSSGKRFWTTKAFREALIFMMKEKKLEVPTTPGFTWGQWLKEQVKCLQGLSQRARKNAWRSMESVDNMETLDYDPQDPEWAAYYEAGGHI